MEKSFPCLTGLLNAQPKSNQSHTSVQNVNPPHIDPSSSMHSLPSPSKQKGKSKKGHVQYCAGPNCGNNRHDNPGLPFLISYMCPVLENEAENTKSNIEIFRFF